jgi:microcystin-dependent protein
LTADWFNDLQENICRVIEAAGIELAKGDYTQLSSALVALSASAVPAGTMAPFAASTPPAGWLKCNGAAISRATYGALFAKIGTTWGAGDGSTTFNLPDLRGEFLRYWDDGRGVDAGRAFGSSQADAFKSHSHSTNWQMSDENGAITDRMGSGGATLESVYFTRSTEATGGPETRPRNVAVLAVIKF